MFSKKATKIDKIFPVDLTLCSKCQTNSEDFVNFCDLLKKHEFSRTALEADSIPWGKLADSLRHCLANT